MKTVARGRTRRWHAAERAIEYYVTIYIYIRLHRLCLAERIDVHSLNTSIYHRVLDTCRSHHPTRYRACSRELPAWHLHES